MAVLVTRSPSPPVAFWMHTRRQKEAVAGRRLVLLHLRSKTNWNRIVLKETEKSHKKESDGGGSIVEVCGADHP